MRYPDLVSRFQVLWDLKESSVRLTVSYQLRKMGFQFHWENAKILHKALGADLNQSNLVVTSRGNYIPETAGMSPYDILNRERDRQENIMNEKFMIECDRNIGTFLSGMDLDSIAKYTRALDKVEGNLQAISEAGDKMDSLQSTQDCVSAAKYQKTLFNQRLEAEGTVTISFPLQAGKVLVGGQ